ncbi:hypothetical protein SHKM778_33350 [Streptomyces sp. KM77-8]|uniref:Uncharacterized protein n=1 Tax=Streptomyces haneummycinicus TaxID=3074435 RepID=A0AAT9HI11_9ACTN
MLPEGEPHGAAHPGRDAREACGPARRIGILGGRDVAEQDAAGAEGAARIELQRSPVESACAAPKVSGKWAAAGE